jgi:hypothetical protein
MVREANNRMSRDETLQLLAVVEHHYTNIPMILRTGSSLSAGPDFGQSNAQFNRINEYYIHVKYKLLASVLVRNGLVDQLILLDLIALGVLMNSVAQTFITSTGGIVDPSKLSLNRMAFAGLLIHSISLHYLPQYSPQPGFITIYFEALRLSSDTKLESLVFSIIDECLKNKTAALKELEKLLF